MDRKTFLAIVKLARKRGFDGKTFKEFKEWANQPEIKIGVFDFGDESYDLDDVEKAWDAKAVKTVTISVRADADEDVVVVDETEAESEEMDEDEEDKEMDEDEEAAKSARIDQRRRDRAEAGMSPDVQRKRAIASKGFGGSGGFKFGSPQDVAKKRYDQAAREFRKLKTGYRPMFDSADKSEWFGAKARLTAFGDKGYPQMANDEKIVAKAGSTSVNSTGGALVFGEYVPELIENIEDHGAARAAIGITPMSEGVRTVSRISDDVTMYDVGENATITASDPTFNAVQLVASKTAGLALQSSELLNDSAFNVGDVLARSFSRAMAKWEDESIFLGSHNRVGVSDNVGANTTFDAALSTSWADYTVSDIQDWLGLLPAWAYSDPKFGIVCSMAFYMKVLRRFALSAGGATPADLVGGAAPSIKVPMFDEIPVYISQVMPKSYSADQLSAYAGAWSYSAKMGVVTGSEQLATSGERYFEKDQIAFRYTQRWAHSLHDVNNTANESGIVAIQD